MENLTTQEIKEKVSQYFKIIEKEDSIKLYSFLESIPKENNDFLGKYKENQCFSLGKMLVFDFNLYNIYKEKNLIFDNEKLINGFIFQFNQIIKLKDLNNYNINLIIQKKHKEKDLDLDKILNNIFNLIHDLNLNKDILHKSVEYFFYHNTINNKNFDLFNDKILSNKNLNIDLLYNDIGFKIFNKIKLLNSDLLIKFLNLPTIKENINKQDTEYQSTLLDKYCTFSNSNLSLEVLKEFKKLNANPNLSNKFGTPFNSLLHCNNYKILPKFTEIFKDTIDFDANLNNKGNIYLNEVCSLILNYNNTIPEFFETFQIILSTKPNLNSRSGLQNKGKSIIKFLETFKGSPEKVNIANILKDTITVSKNFKYNEETIFPEKTKKKNNKI